jgi:hypothetical protein
MNSADLRATTAVAMTDVPALAAARAELSGVAIAWSAFWRSRLLIWVAGCLGVALLGSFGYDRLIDPSGVTSALGTVGNFLTAPAVRWDSVWYLQIAHHGYTSATETAFFPLYPFLVGAGSWLTRSAEVSGIAISSAALFAGLYIVQRLAELELGGRAARTTVNLLAFTPMTVFFSAVYTEALFLALSAGTFYAARQGRWKLAGIVGGLAAMTRMTGILLLLPVLILFFYGPRSDKPQPTHPRRLRPSYGFAPQLLWTALIPCGAAAFLGYLALRGFNVSVSLHAEEQLWARHFVQPLAVIGDGAVSAWHELRLATSSLTMSGYERQSLIQFAALAVSAGALVGVFRRLPFAYGAYAGCALLMSLSSEAAGKALVSYDRYAVVVFPLYMWAGAWAAERGSARRLIVLSSLFAVGFTIEFATWRFVA